MNHARVIGLMKSFDRDLGMIEDAYRKAGILGQTLFVITSDHGMVPVKRFISADVVKQAASRAGTTTTSIAYNHSVYLWLKDVRKAGAVAGNVVRAHDPGVKSVYYLTATRHGQRYVRVPGTWLRPEVESANQYLLATLMNGHQPAVVVFCRQDATFSSSATHWKADHGGASWQSQHIPLILSGPGIRSGAVIGQPAQLEDVAPTVLADMGVQPTGMEGHVLTDALHHTTASTLHSRALEIRSLQPVVHALIVQDVNERRY
jgi:arylsulfatase A-like enzyme